MDGVVLCAQEMLLPRHKGKGHCITCHREGVKVYHHSCLTSALDGRGWPCLSREEAPGHMLKSAPQVRSGWAWRTEYLLHPPGLDPWSVQPVSSGQLGNLSWYISANNTFFIVFLHLGDSRRLNFICGRLGTLCSISIRGVTVFFLPTPPVNME